MASTAVSYTYRYPFASTVLEEGSGAQLRMATSLDETSDDLFFDGKLRRPGIAGKMLSILSDTVRTRFYQRFDPLLLDPVVTSGGGMLRFEGFSSCCGVYSRVDLEPSAFNVDLRGKGTTNVDFNDPMRIALRKLSDRDEAGFQVGGTGVTLTRGEEKIIERKVKLPLRWIKGFCEVQAYQPRLIPQLEMTGLETRELFRGLPRGSSRSPAFITRVGRTYRITPTQKRGAVRVEGSNRIRVIENLLPYVQQVRVWYDPESWTNGWELQTEIGRYFTLISPELDRGFSGEGQMLEKLAVGDWKNSLPQVSAALNWQSQIDPGEVSMRNGIGEGAVEAALAVLGARGLAGFDVATGKYFHRVLPFDLELVEKFQPRLVNARELVDRVRILSQSPGEVTAEVPGSEWDHLVRLRDAGNQCDCRWFARYDGRRGPCKHILAVRLKVEGPEAFEQLQSEQPVEERGD